MIKNRRVMEGLTQEELARNCGISASWLSRLERGRSFPSADFLIRVARKLNIDVFYLLACAAYAAINEPGVRDNTLIEIAQALKYTAAKNGTGVKK